MVKTLKLTAVAVDKGTYNDVVAQGLVIWIGVVFGE